MKNNGFTLVELMIVIAIIAILSAIAIPAYKLYLKTSNQSVLDAEISDMREAFNLYLVSNGKMPQNMQELGMPEFESGMKFTLTTTGTNAQIHAQNGKALIFSLKAVTVDNRSLSQFQCSSVTSKAGALLPSICTKTAGTAPTTNNVTGSGTTSQAQTGNNPQNTKPTCKADEDLVTVPGTASHSCIAKCATGETRQADLSCKNTTGSTAPKCPAGQTAYTIFKTGFSGPQLTYCLDTCSGILDPIGRCCDKNHLAGQWCTSGSYTESARHSIVK